MMKELVRYDKTLNEAAKEKNIGVYDSMADKSNELANGEPKKFSGETKYHVWEFLYAIKNLCNARGIADDEAGEIIKNLCTGKALDHVDMTFPNMTQPDAEEIKKCLVERFGDWQTIMKQIKEEHKMIGSLREFEGEPSKKSFSENYEKAKNHLILVRKVELLKKQFEETHIYMGTSNSASNDEVRTLKNYIESFYTDQLVQSLSGKDKFLLNGPHLSKIERYSRAVRILEHTLKFSSKKLEEMISKNGKQTDKGGEVEHSEYSENEGEGGEDHDDWDSQPSDDNDGDDYRGDGEESSQYPGNDQGDDGNDYDNHGYDDDNYNDQGDDGNDYDNHGYDDDNYNDQGDDGDDYDNHRYDDDNYSDQGDDGNDKGDDDDDKGRYVFNQEEEEQKAGETNKEIFSE